MNVKGISHRLKVDEDDIKNCGLHEKEQGKEEVADMLRKGDMSDLHDSGEWNDK